MHYLGFYPDLSAREGFECVRPQSEMGLDIMRIWLAIMGYSGDLNTEQVKVHYSDKYAIQMLAIQIPTVQPTSTRCKTQVGIWIHNIWNTNFYLFVLMPGIVCYSSHGLNNELFVQYIGDLNTKKLLNRNSNGRSMPMGYALCTKPTIQILNQYIRKQDGVHLSGIQMVELSGIQMVELSSIQMALKNRTFGIQHLFDYLNTRLDQISDSHCI